MSDKKTDPILRFFRYQHLKPGLPQDISKMFSEFVDSIEKQVPPSAERTAGLRKILEAKDCFVRAALPVDVETLSPGEDAAVAQGLKSLEEGKGRPAEEVFDHWRKTAP